MNIKVDLKIFLFLLLFLVTSQFNIYILLMLFAFIHELGHLAMGLILGFKPKEIKVTPVGMKIEFAIKCEEYNKKILKGNLLGIKREIIALAGPLTNFIIVIIVSILKNIKPELEQISFFSITTINLQDVIYANLLIAIFNLIPIYPLDGGRIIKEILHICIGLGRSEKYTYMISKTMIILLTAISSVVILYIRNISILIIVVYLWILMIIEKRRYDTRRKIRKIQQLQQVANRDLEKNLQIK